MRRLPFSLLAAGLAALLASPATAADPPRRLTVETIFAADASGRRAGDLAWSPDGSRLAYRWDDGAGEALWLLDPATGKSEAVLRLAEVREDEEKLEIDSYLWSPRGDALLLAAGGDLYLYPLAARILRRLTATEAEETAPGFSPDGGRMAFVRDYDLHLIDLATGQERALTADGEENAILNGTTDWVYWEEIWDRAATGYWWSPDGRRIAYYRFDESPVGVYPLVTEADPAAPAKVTWQKYPRPGEPNPRVRLGVLDLDSGKTTWMATAPENDKDAEDSYLARVDWTPDGKAVAIQRLDRDQTRLDLLRCGAADGSCKTLLTETWPTWVNLGDDFRFLADGRFLWGSERSGWRRLYLYSPEGRLLRAVTPEGWSVTSLDGVSEDGEWLVFGGFRIAGLSPDRASRMGPAERHVGRARLSEDGFEPLTSEPGWHEAEVAPRTGFWVHTWSDAETPHRAEVRRPDGSAAVPLPSAPPRFDAAALPRWEFTTIAGPEGSRLPARLLKPEGFDPARRYPVIVYHYGGPGSQVVVDRWDSRGRDLWHKMLAQRGFAVAMVDNLSSLFFGKPGEDRDHRGMGAGNLAAQLALVDHLKSLPWVDASRIGLWGWSGGGFNTLYCLFHRPGVWKAGIAGAPVTDWRLYDSIWTERYLDTPQDNPEGYRASSPFHDAAQLRDRLLVIHGLADDNVHPQNTVALSDRLVQAGISFEQAFYPGQKHGFRGDSQKHLYARMTEFFERTLQEVAVVHRSP